MVKLSVARNTERTIIATNTVVRVVLFVFDVGIIRFLFLKIIDTHLFYVPTWKKNYEKNPSQRFLQIVYNRNRAKMTATIKNQLLASKDVLEERSATSNTEIIISATYMIVIVILFVLDVGIIRFIFS